MMTDDSLERPTNNTGGNGDLVAASCESSEVSYHKMEKDFVAL